MNKFIIFFALLFVVCVLTEAAIIAPKAVEDDLVGAESRRRGWGHGFGHGYGNGFGHGYGHGFGHGFGGHHRPHGGYGHNGGFYRPFGGHHRPHGGWGGYF